MRLIRYLLAAVALVGMAGCVTLAPTQAGRFPDRLVGLGTEPFWNVTVNGGQIGYRDPETPNQQTAQVSRHSEGGRLHLTGRLDGRALRAVFVTEQCSDGMSDRTYPYSLVLTLGGRTLRGCAYPAPSPM